MNIAASPTNPVTFSFFIGPMTQDLHWSRGDVSWAITFRLVVAGITGPLLGQAIDRYGPRWIGVFAGIVAGGSLAAISLVSDLPFLYLIFAISGLAGFGGPAGALITIVPVGKWFIAKRGRAMALATMGFPLGTVAVIQIAQWLIASSGWRTAWLAFGAVLVAVVAPTSALLMRRVPEDHGLRPDGRRDLHGVTPLASALVQGEVHWSRREALRTPAMWLILGAQVLMGFALAGTLVHRVAFWQDLGMPPAIVALGTAADPFTVVFSAVVFGIIGERIAVRYLGLVAGLGMGSSMLPMIFASGGTASIFLHGVTWGWFAGAFITVNNLIWPNYYGRKSLGAIQGVVLPVSVISNGLAAPFYGFLLDSGLPPAAVWSLSLTLFCVAGCLLLLAKPPAGGPRNTVLAGGN